MTFDVCYTTRERIEQKQPGEPVIATVKTEAEAFEFCRNLSNFPASTVHYSIHCEATGRTVYDTRRDGLL